MPYKDPEAYRLYQTAWRIANAEKLKADKKAQYQANKELRKSQSRAWYAANKERVRVSSRARYEKDKDRLLAYSKARHKATYREKHPLLPKPTEAERTARALANRAAYTVANKEKIIASNRAYRLNNAEKVAAARNAWKDANPEKNKARITQWQIDNRDKINTQKNARRKANPEHTRAEKAQIRAIKLKATPAWANRVAIKLFYRVAAEMERTTGVKHAVDHIVPLISKLVCGLHVQDNLQVLTAKANASKGNYTWPDKP
jgi:hypothetical protein